VQQGGNCLLLDRQEGRLPARLFPNRFNSTMSVPAGQTVFIPPAGQGNLSVAGPAGLHQVRLIVVPADVTLDLATPAAWADKATIIEREYRVVPATDR
jgi:phage terminase large subunit-like protein